MNTTPSENSILVKLHVPAAHQVYPESNYVGTRILGRLFEMALQPLGPSEVIPAGPFNRAMFLIHTALPERAAAVIKEAVDLPELGLQGHVDICLFDGRELVWRAVHPSAGSVHFNDVILKQLTQELEESNRILAELEEANRSLANRNKGLADHEGQRSADDEAAGS